MTADPRAVLHLALKRDLASFVHRALQTVLPGETFHGNWHLEVIAGHLQAVLEGRITRLIITLPPRSLKSLSTSVAFPAWVLGHDPARRIVCASYSQELAAKHARDCRAVMQSHWYGMVFPKTRLDPSKSGEGEFMTTRRGYRLATSVGGTLTGRGGNLIIIDDPMKAGDAWSTPAREAVNQWFANTLLSRLDDKGHDAIIVVTQRLHTDDLVGHLLANDPDWVHLSLPAIATADQWFHLADGRVVGRRAGEALHPAREPLPVLEGLRRTLGSHVFSAQYQQEPLPLDGGLVTWSWFRTYDGDPGRLHDDRVIQSWDTASKDSEVSDWSVCTTWLWRGEEHYLLDVFRGRLTFPDLLRKVAAWRDRFKADTVLIEDAGSGTALIQQLRAERTVFPIGIKPEDGKVSRMMAETAAIEAGKVLIPAEASWLPDFQAELLQFPHGRHDDQVDALSQYLGWARRNRPYTTIEFYAVESRASRTIREIEAAMGTGMPDGPWTWGREGSDSV